MTETDVITISISALYCGTLVGLILAIVKTMIKSMFGEEVK